MDDNTAAAPSTTSQDQQISSFMFVEESEAEAENQQQRMHHPFSSSSSVYYHHQHPLSGGEDSGAGSEEGLDVPEEPAKPARSGSKRSRAAEVHNLSEKRRRSRINEKMKALQNLIPNSNKTDKASMLDEAIEYLKQLQLQVQMLSMRNGLNSLPTYLPGALHPLQASQLCMNFGDNSSAMNLGVLGMLSLNQDSTANNSFDLTSQSTSHQTVMLPTTSISAHVTSFGLESSQSHRPSFQLQEILTQDMVSQQQLDSGRTTGSLSENVMKTMDMASTLHFGGQASSSLEHNDHLENLLSKDHPDHNPIFAQNFDGYEFQRLQTGRSFAKNDVKPEALGI